MNRLILKTALFATCCVALFLFLLSRADGRTDAFYLRFTSPVQDNLIIGTSRSAQALQPAVFNELLNRSFYNYSFTVAHSPFGPVYLNSIRKKLNPTMKNGVFLITIDPWSITEDSEHAEDSLQFGENDLCLGKTSRVNMKPNFEYLWENLQGNYYRVLFPEQNGQILHDDGWLEVDIAMDSATVNRRIKRKIDYYMKDMLPGRVLSNVRLNYLLETIRFLKVHGAVYLVRLPVGQPIYEIEQLLMPNFDEVIAQAVRLSDGYLNMVDQNERYRYTDGNHLYKESGREVSLLIAEWVRGKK